MRKTTSLTELLLSEASMDRYYTEQSNELSRKRRMKDLLRKAISLELTERQRNCLVLYYYEEMPVKDIAARIGIRATTVYKHLRTAKTILRHFAVYL